MIVLHRELIRKILYFSTGICIRHEMFDSRRFVFNVTTNLRYKVGKKIYMATAAVCDFQLIFQFLFLN
jgi:hypothetical protein